LFSFVQSFTRRKEAWNISLALEYFRVPLLSLNKSAVCGTPPPQPKTMLEQNIVVPTRFIDGNSIRESSQRNSVAASIAIIFPWGDSGETENFYSAALYLCLDGNSVSRRGPRAESSRRPSSDSRASCWLNRER
jgi:hypothetical protein